MCASKLVKSRLSCLHSGISGGVRKKRKAAIELEMEITGASAADVVRGGSDARIARTRSEHDRVAWIASAKEGIADEARHLEQNGPSLARFRRV